LHARGHLPADLGRGAAGEAALEDLREAQRERRERGARRVRHEAPHLLQQWGGRPCVHGLEKDPQRL
jgi:hypothetical protein